jgi:hypothetical protein
MHVIWKNTDDDIRNKEFLSSLHPPIELMKELMHAVFNSQEDYNRNQ